MRLILILIVSLLFGCTTKFERQKIRAEKFYNEYPNEFAIKAADKFPTKEIFIKGKDIIIIDSVFSVDTLRSEITKTDTIRLTIKKYINRTDTILFENTANIKTLGNRISKLEYDLEAEKNKLSKSNKTKNIFIYISVGLFVLIIGGGLYLLKGKIASLV